MKLIVGLGNPGKKYENTLHNAGFMVLDELAKKLNFTFKTSKKFSADIAELEMKGKKIIFVKPLKFMNLSGNPVSKLISYYKIEIKDLWVVSDDADLPLERIRIRLYGSSAGHKGLQSIIDSAKNDAFVRFRIGIAPIISHNDEMDERNEISLKNYVLSPLHQPEKNMLKKSINYASNLVIEALKNKVIKAHTY